MHAFHIGRVLPLSAPHALVVDSRPTRPGDRPLFGNGEFPNGKELLYVLVSLSKLADPLKVDLPHLLSAAATRRSDPSHS